MLGQGEAAEVGETKPTVPAQELEDLQKDLPQYLRNLSSDDADVLVWHVLLLPVSVPGILVLGWGDLPWAWLGLGKNFPCVGVPFFTASAIGRGFCL